MDQRLDMIMPVQEGFSAMFGQNFAKRLTVDEALEEAFAARRMMHQHDPEQIALAELVQQRGEPPKLVGAETSRGHERTRRQRTREADESNRTAPAHEGESPLASISA